MCFSTQDFCPYADQVGDWQLDVEKKEIDWTKAVQKREKMREDPEGMYGSAWLTLIFLAHVDSHVQLCLVFMHCVLKS